MSRCTTHHHACDCREERFRILESENKAWEKAAQAVVDECERQSWNGDYVDALAALLKGKAE